MYLVKTLKMGKLSWIITARIRRRIGDQSQRETEMGKRYTIGSKAGGWGHQSRNTGGLKKSEKAREWILL